MDRTLTTKSVSLREIGQWTAATTLVAAGALALFSAATLEKLSRNGEVSVDLQAFKKLGSASLALDRTDEQRMIEEEARLLDRAAYASAEALPATHTAFTKIRLHPRKARAAAVAKNTVIAPLIAPALPTPTPIPRTLSGSPVVLSESDAAEIAQLERAPDPASESQSLAQVYRNLRFQFVTAAQQGPKEGFPADSIAIAANAVSLEYDEVPEFDPEDFKISAADESRAIAVETAPAKIDAAPIGAVEEPMVVSVVEEPTDKDTISISSSVEAPPSQMNALTANGLAMQDARKPVTLDSTKTLPSATVIASPGLDLVPEPAALKREADSRVVVATHGSEVKQATGPPAEADSITQTPPYSLPAKSPSGLVANTENNKLDSVPSDKPMAGVAMDSPSDLREYSSDVTAAYQGVGAKNADGVDDSAAYSAYLNEDSVVDGDFSARPGTRGTVVTTNSAGNIGRTGASAIVPKNSGYATIRSTLPVGARVAAKADAPKDYGSGIHSDAKGITIDWNEASVDGGKVADTTLGGKVFVGKPGSALADNAGDVQTSLKKFSFAAPAKEVVTESIKLTQSGAKSADPTEPAVDTKKCDSARVGMEAFNAGAEKESLSVCRRELSLEGTIDGSQSRWWESYENEAEHWPTLSYAKIDETSPTHRIPLLSTASIRILSAISKTNTHTGTGILFGEVAKGLEIQLLGRSDSPIYLDAGMKLRDPAADATGARQFVFLNVEPGQPLLVVKSREKNLSGAIPLVVKGGMATHLSVREPRELDIDFTVFDASTAKEARLANLTAEVIGQPGKMGITDRTGTLKIRKVAVFDDFPVYIDVLKNEKSYKNRFRIRATTIAHGAFPLFFFDEKRVGSWLAQLSGGLSPYSGLIAGVVPNSVVVKNDPRFLKIGILEKKSSLVPERYLLDEKDRLVSESTVTPGHTRYIGVQIPEGPAIPTIVDAKGAVLWSELVYAQPGVINVVSPDL